MVSALTDTPVRKNVAMTGEITLRGRVLAIGGLKEKVLAAHRAGIDTIIIPADNKKDLDDIPENVRKRIKFVIVDRMETVLNTALVNKINTDVEAGFKQKDEDVIIPEEVSSISGVSRENPMVEQ